MLTLVLAVNTASSSYQAGRLAGMVFAAAIMFVILIKMVAATIRDSE